jgi:hypothetical protein
MPAAAPSNGPMRHAPRHRAEHRNEWYACQRSPASGLLREHFAMPAIAPAAAAAMVLPATSLTTPAIAPAAVPTPPPVAFASAGAAPGLGAQEALRATLLTVLASWSAEFSQMNSKITRKCDELMATCNELEGVCDDAEIDALRPLDFSDGDEGDDDEEDEWGGEEDGDWDDDNDAVWDDETDGRDWADERSTTPPTDDAEEPYPVDQDGGATSAPEA